MKKAARHVVSLMAIGLLCLGAASTARAAEEPKTVSVEVMEALKAVSVQAKLIGKLGADALRIKVRVAGSTAILTGEVTKKSSQKLAQSVALSVAGIKKVDNQVTQKNPPEPVANAEANVKDALLLTKVKTILLTDIGVNALKIDVDVTNGVVSLRGTLGKPEVNEEALKKTQSIKGVKKVINLLT
jgi:osmotically-inducible protein OsmY